MLFHINTDERKFFNETNVGDTFIDTDGHIYMRIQESGTYDSLPNSKTIYNTVCLENGKLYIFDDYDEISRIIDCVLTETH